MHGKTKQALAIGLHSIDVGVAGPYRGGTS